ncbi:NAD-dependent epimerase/dehydratase family protein [Mucilaginibacter dorajii]|uniref:NAD-dependent epimerase/dehydratase n=1 Tax=Mucilaginibacter dorajii TaxID=692994 RepID=A0ABP7PIM3_9SPHI|nr:NAD-dependent epimerase/dehydratase family protein [Mucilaginibacter dorajii]MCS3733423.1 nucleoside-diphosphate-sugar epimerase [Mucilaginibacter dorajii]
MGDIKKLLITGASGFLGSRLLEMLLKESYSPVVYLRQSSDTWRIKNLQGDYEIFIAADNSESSIQKLFDEHEIEGILHIATEYGRQKSLSSIIETNVLFPLRLIEAGLKRGLKLFINTDTFFGKKQFDLQYLSDYTTSKRVLEGLLNGLASKLTIANLRIEHVYGENDSESKFVTSVIKQAILNNDEILLTEGLQKRDFIYVDDVANAYISVLKYGNLTHGYNEYEVGTGISIRVKDFVTGIANTANSKSNLNFGAIAVRAGEIEDSSANITALTQLGWAPEYDMNKALKKIITAEKKRFAYENGI